MLETIVAPATPYGESSIGVIRISGSKALEIVKLLTKTKDFKNRYAHSVSYTHLRAHET